MSWYHLTKCSARSLTTADRTPDTRDDFGFSRCRTWMEESHLIGLYRGMVALSDEIYAPDLHEWRERGES